MKSTAWFIASFVPVCTFALGGIDPSFIDVFYATIGFPSAVVLAVAFIGRTVRAKDIRASEKFAWIAALILFLPFGLALPLFAYARIVIPAKAATIPTSHSQIQESKTA